MRVRKLDENGDLGTSGQMFVFDKEAVKQTAETRLRLYSGEYFRNINDGTPWFQQILGKFQNINAVEAILRSRIAQTPGVVRLLSFELNSDGAYDVSRQLNVSSTVLTTWGAQEVEASNNG